MLKNKSRAVYKSQQDYHISMKQMKLAVSSVLEGGETPTCVARKFGISRFSLLTSLLREKKRLRAKAENSKENSEYSRKPFQSKFTTNQLLSARNEEDLAQYLKQCYETQWPKSNQQNLPLLSEETVRSLSYTFIRMHNLRYSKAWDAKQQASAGWLNGYIDRNPEIIEFVKLSLRRNDIRQQPNNILQYVEKITKNAHDDVVLVEQKRDLESYDDGDQCDWSFPEANSIYVKIAPEVQETSSTSSMHKIKEETSYNLSAEIIDHRKYDTDMGNDELMNTMIPELVYNNIESTTAAQVMGSIAESVKRRTTRKPRIISEDDEFAMGVKEKEAETLNSKQQPHQINGSPNEIKTAKQTVKKGPLVKKDPLVELQETINKIHGDVNYLLQSILTEMTENNRLLRGLIARNV